MLALLRQFFIPHAGNNYKPHLFHTKRTVLYSAVFLVTKAIVVGFVLLLPSEAFLLPDVLAEQNKKIVELTNALRASKGLPVLAASPQLSASAEARVQDMIQHNYFSHVGPDNHTLAYFLNQTGYGYRVAGENLAMGFPDAESVMAAWMRSPSHYANLIDSDYSQIGVGLESGYYHGEPTVFVAEHFGDPASSVVRSSSGAVQGKKITAKYATSGIQVEVPAVDFGQSFVDWHDDNGRVELTVRAVITGAVNSAHVLVDRYPIPLHRFENNTYVGVLKIDESSDDLFRTIIIPTITVVGADGTVITTGIDWKQVKLVSPGPLEKYLHAKRLVSSFTKIFDVSQKLYMFFTVFFAAAMVVMIVVEYRKQHYRTIAQTLLMVGLLVILWKV